MRCICALVLLGIAWSAGLVSAEIPPAWGGKARHIIIAVIDGPRWSESWGDPLRANIPHQAKELLPQGTLYTNFRNSGWTYTTCGHTALTTGLKIGATTGRRIDIQFAEGNPFGAQVHFCLRAIAAPACAKERRWSGCIDFFCLCWLILHAFGKLRLILKHRLRQPGDWGIGELERRR